MSENGTVKIYQVITDQIIAALEKGVVPWQQPWKGRAQFPRNAKSGKPYRGVNVFILHFKGIANGYTSPLWMSYKQAVDLGGKVKPGEKGTPVTFWKPFEIADETAKSGKKRIMMIRYYTVFNYEQTEGVKLPKKMAELNKPVQVNEFTPIEEAQRIIEEYVSNGGPKIKHGGSGAFYVPDLDVITLPDQESFKDADHYYSTAFHECGHSTGHESRLKRTGVLKHAGFGSPTYSEEELVAEMTAAFLNGEAGLSGNAIIDDNAAYLGHWLSVLKANPKLIVQIAGQAQKAADHIMGRQWEAAINEQAAA